MHLTFLRVEVQKRTELSETLKVFASQPGYVFQSDDLGLIRGTGSLG